MTTEAGTTLAERFRGHFDGERHLYWHLTRAMADDLEEGGPTARIVAGHLDAPPGAVVQLRLLAALFRVVLRGEAPGLEQWYPCLGGRADPATAWPVVREVLAAQEGRLRGELDVAPQTNEPGRAVALLVGLREALTRHGASRVRLLEVGASAGVNLLPDHYRFVGHGWAAGPEDSPCVVVGAGAPGFEPVPFEVAERRGCDLHPVDASTPEGALRLRSFVWPFMLERHARLNGALEVLAAHPVRVEEEAAGVWLETVLAEPVEPGVLTVVWQSVTRQYWPDAERERVDAAVAAARRRLPLAYVTMEPPAAGGHRVTDHSAELPLIEVDGVAVGRCGFHGPPVTLLPER